jgi:DNA-binding NarL/FixJ family response regulator
VLPHLASGATNAQVAAPMGLPKTMVAGRRKGILDAFGMHTIFEAVQLARARGLL